MTEQMKTLRSSERREVVRALKLMKDVAKSWAETAVENDEAMRRDVKPANRQPFLVEDIYQMLEEVAREMGVRLDGVVRVIETTVLGPYTFEAVETDFEGFDRSPGKLMYRYRISGKPVNMQLFESLDRALVFAVGEKLSKTSARSAVPTLVDGFLRTFNPSEQ